MRLDPKPVYDVKRDDFNTEIVAYEQLLDPDTKPASFDLILTSNLVSGMQWTGPKNPMAESAANQRDAKFGQKLDSALAYRWLVVVRPYDVVNPVATSETTFHGGTAKFDIFVVNMQTKQIEDQGRFDAKSASSVDYLAKRGESKEARLEDFARSTMFTEARKKLAILLERTTGGTFVFEHN